MTLVRLKGSQPLDLESRATGLRVRVCVKESRRPEFETEYYPGVDGGITLNTFAT